MVTWVIPVPSAPGRCRNRARSPSRSFPDFAAAGREDGVVRPGRQVQLLVLEIEALGVAVVELLDLRDVLPGQLARATLSLGVRPAAGRCTTAISTIATSRRQFLMTISSSDAGCARRRLAGAPSSRRTIRTTRVECLHETGGRHHCAGAWHRRVVMLWFCACWNDGAAGCGLVSAASPRCSRLAAAAPASVRGAGGESRGSGDWVAPRTPDGQPDLQGVWTNATMTPLERPADLAGKAFFSEAEAAALERAARERREQGVRAGRRPDRAPAAGHQFRRLQRSHLVRHAIDRTDTPDFDGRGSAERPSPVAAGSGGQAQLPGCQPHRLPTRT